MSGIDLFSLFDVILCPTCHRSPSARYPDMQTKKMVGGVSDECPDQIHDLADELVRLYVRLVQGDPAAFGALLLKAKDEQYDEAFRKRAATP
jgi:hypothetical protein